MKYIRGYWIVHRGEDVYAVDAGDKSKRIHLTHCIELLSGAVPRIVRQYCPELTDILRDSRIAVSNSLVASQVRELVYVIMDAGYPDSLPVEYAPNSVHRTNLTWIVEDGYWGGPDDWHRSPSKVLHRLFVDDEGFLTNSLSDIYPKTDGHGITEQPGGRYASVGRARHLRRSPSDNDALTSWSMML